MFLESTVKERNLKQNQKRCVDRNVEHSVEQERTEVLN